MRRYGLRDDQWDRIKDLLPAREVHVSATAADNRLFVEAVLYRYRAGVPWRDLPERFGDWKNTQRRLRRWCESVVFQRIFKILAEDRDNEYMMLDSTIVWAHQHSAGARKRGGQIPGMSSHRAFAGRIDDQNPCHGACARKSRRPIAYPRPTLRSQSGRTTARGGRPASLSCR